MNQFKVIIIWIWFAMGMLLPNSLFWLINYYTHTFRPYFNLDYILITVLCCLSSRWCRLSGYLLLIITFLADCLLIIGQLTPVNNIHEALSLLPLLFKGPIDYQLLFALALVWLIIIWLIYVFQPTGGNNKFKVLIGLMLMVSGLMVAAIDDITISQSQIMAYYQSSYNGFIEKDKPSSIVKPVKLQLLPNNDYFNPPHDITEIHQPDARLANSGTKSLALQLLSQSKSKKILFILDESWGFNKNPLLTKEILNNILADRAQFQYFEGGRKIFDGVTLQAELKELCQIKPQELTTDKLTKKDFAGCLPHLLRKRGYTTFGIHGSTGDFYQRADWYPKAGFQYQKFLENMSPLPRCGSFNGVCDQALFPEVKKMLLAKPKTFVHWMTLTTHYPYQIKDIFNKRLDCKRYGMEEETAPCRNLRLHTQFFDQLAQWLKDPELKGLEVVIIGDHEPPIYNVTQREKIYQPINVSWLHFKLRE